MVGAMRGALRMGSIFDEDFLTLEGVDSLLLSDGSSKLILFSAGATRDFRQFPDDGQRAWPIPIDLVRKWPST